MAGIRVSIESRYPIHMEVDAESFGELFAGFCSDEQVAVFRAMVEHMKPHRMQWDYIAIELEKDENRDVRNDMSVIFPSTETALVENAKLRSLLAPFAEIARHDIGETETDEDFFTPMTQHNRAARLVVGDFRRALAAVGEKDDG